MDYKDQIDQTRDKVENLDIDNCVKGVLFDELRKAEFFAGKLSTCKPEQVERLYDGLCRHVGYVMVMLVGIERYNNRIDGEIV